MKKIKILILKKLSLSNNHKGNIDKIIIEKSDMVSFNFREIIKFYSFKKFYQYFILNTNHC